MEVEMEVGMEGKWPETATIGINGINTMVADSGHFLPPHFHSDEHTQIMAFELVHTNTCELSFMALIYH